MQVSECTRRVLGLQWFYCCFGLLSGSSICSNASPRALPASGRSPPLPLLALLSCLRLLTRSLRSTMSKHEFADSSTASFFYCHSSFLKESTILFLSWCTHLFESEVRTTHLWPRGSRADPGQAQPAGASRHLQERKPFKTNQTKEEPLFHPFDFDYVFDCL